MTYFPLATLMILGITQHIREHDCLKDLRDTWYFTDPPFEVPVIRSYDVYLVFHNSVYQTIIRVYSFVITF